MQKPEKVEISVRKLNSLRRLLIEASEEIKRLAAGGSIPTTPGMTAEEKREIHYDRMIEGVERSRKPAHLRKTKPRN